MRCTVFFILFNFYIDLAGFLGFPLFLPRHRFKLIVLHVASILPVLLHMLLLFCSAALLSSRAATSSFSKTIQI